MHWPETLLAGGTVGVQAWQGKQAIDKHKTDKAASKSKREELLRELEMTGYDIPAFSAVCIVCETCKEKADLSEHQSSSGSAHF